MAQYSQNYMIHVDMDVMQGYLKSYKITQKDLSEYLGISLRTYGYWRKTNHIPASAFLKICDLFGWLDIPNTLGFDFVEL